jgi:outer membrane receptor protein involved in Fe transport
LSGNSYASFLLGLPAPGNNIVPGTGNNTLADVFAFPATLGRYFAPYIQDDWKVTRKLTLNLGIRWDFNVAPNERYDNMNVGFDPTVTNPAGKLVDRTQFSGLSTLKGGLLFAGNGLPRLVANIDKTAIQPRFGVAYQINENLVFRGGFGKFYVNPNNDYIKNNGFSVTCISRVRCR